MLTGSDIFELGEQPFSFDESLDGSHLNLNQTQFERGPVVIDAHEPQESQEGASSWNSFLSKIPANADVKIQVPSHWEDPDELGEVPFL